MRHAAHRLALGILFGLASLPVVVPAQGPLPAAEAPARMSLPPGFQATLFAGEPDLVQPMSMCLDDRGRLWVAEGLAYPEWKQPGQTGADRIVILTDENNDGKFDQRKIFWDQAVNLSGIEVGFGGVWLCSTPNLVFVPDRNQDDVPDGPPVVVLDGWDLKARHNVFNGLTWGPDGWLYGCNGILSNSLVGPPGALPNARTALNCGVWRYHPLSKQFEVVASGTTNPWGLDFDSRGEMFITNCVIKHLFHVIPGAHYQRMFGQDLATHSYQLIESCADHLHWAGGPWQSSRGGQGDHSAAGGGHAHAGAMVYLGDNWPAEYRDRIFMCNIHGNRVNQNLLERSGSGYICRRAPDFLFANDPWFRGLELLLGPDGGVYVSDWCDTGECHDYEEVDRGTGRIFKVLYGKPTPQKIDLAKLTEAELVALQTHRNAWFARHAQRLLQERAAERPLDATSQGKLHALLKQTADRETQLRALWCLHVTGGLDTNTLRELMQAPEVELRVWAVRLALEQKSASDATLARLAKLAHSDPAPQVRLALASGLQRLPLAQRWEIALALVAHGEDASDANLPLMIWYGIEPLVAAEPERSPELVRAARIPLVRQFLARRLTALAN